MKKSHNKEPVQSRESEALELKIGMGMVAIQEMMKADRAEDIDAAVNAWDLLWSVIGDDDPRV